MTNPIRLINRTMLLFRRHKLIKLIIAISILWLIIIMLFHTDKRSRRVTEDNYYNVYSEEESLNVQTPPRNTDGPGEMGRPVKIENPDKETKEMIDKGWKDNAFNQYVSDMISVHRSLPDPRDDWCKAEGRFLTDLPATSVVVCFHNEAWSTLLRTVHSILDRSPPHLIEQIVLVDDASTVEHVKDELDIYMAQYHKVKIVRAPERVGLIRARLMGARYVTAPVITYLDSHCECTEGWLEPLLDRIARDKTTVVCPVIDVINEDTLEYLNSGSFSVGGFDWNLEFDWHEVPDHEKKRHNHSAEAVRSPTMAGGLFSIDREFFERLGAYDPGFEIWGGENLELSFKTWMCGGTLEIVPCSHVGHIFRDWSPYEWKPGVDVLRRNSIRLAEVWMDDYKKYFYERINHDLGDFGDISSRVQLRNSLQCKSFQWYIEEIYPELYIPGESLASGDISNDWSNLCVDNNARPGDVYKAVSVFPCHKQGGSQYWMLSLEGEIRRDGWCLVAARSEVILYPCDSSEDDSQYWEYDHQEAVIIHTNTKRCLALNNKTRKLGTEICNRNNPRQRWKFQNYGQAKEQV